MSDDHSLSNAESRPRNHVRSVLVFVAVIALATCAEPFWNWELRALPGNVGVDRVLASDSSFGLREGCDAVLYRLSAATIDRVAAEGATYLARGGPALDENLRNPYGAWHETPIGIDVAKNGRGSGSRTIFALQAMTGCGSPSGDLHYREIEAALSTPGSYYMLTANKEGIVIVAPRYRLAAYFYNG